MITVITFLHVILTGRVTSNMHYTSSHCLN